MKTNMKSVEGYLRDAERRLNFAMREIQLLQQRVEKTKTGEATSEITDIELASRLSEALTNTSGANASLSTLLGFAMLNIEKEEEN